MARLANDLLHPDAFRGEMPVLVSPSEVPPADRVRLKRMIDAIGAGDRRRAGALAATLARSSTALVRVAAAAGGFDKGEPDEAIAALEAIAADPDADAAARDRARMLAALASAWSGGDRDVACRALRVSAKPPTD